VEDEADGRLADVRKGVATGTEGAASAAAPEPPAAVAAPTEKAT
jgi:hypothetical protein